MKIIAFYLPQYHPIPENDAWWGKGFTEWSNLKNARSLFKGHNQPRVPLNDNYYHLLDADVQRWQAMIAQQHGVDGFCYYHYWFNGKRLLEKPIEQVLRTGEPDFPFCLAWANEPWSRAWDGRDKDVIMPQCYGSMQDWEEHFQALLPSFKDRRYIRFKDRPVFLVYKTASIPDCNEMITYWQKRAKDEGLSGLHIVSMLTAANRDERGVNVDAYVEFEPMNTIAHHLPLNARLYRRLRIRFAKLLERFIPKFEIVYDNIGYGTIWNNICARKLPVNTYPGAFVDWDNSPRKNIKSTVMKGSSVDEFKNYFHKQYIKAHSQGAPFLFINAWNEWCEGTYLEPDTLNEYKYLEVVKSVVGANINK